MNSWRISAAEERWLTLASRFRAQCSAPIFVERIAGWRNVRLISRCAFFVLGCAVAVMTLSICHLLYASSPLIAGLLLIAAGEWLILQRRLVFSGIEEALQVAGWLTIAADVGSRIHSSADVVAALLAALALAIAGLRLLNPLFTTLAVAVLSLAVELAMDTRSFAFDSRATLVAGLFCYAIGWLALGLGAIWFKRPSYDRMLDWLAIAMPLGGYLWLMDSHHLLAPLAPSVFGVTALLIGMRRRTHAPLLAFMICVACLAYELRRLTGLSLEMRLILWGTLLLAAALFLDRFLRTPRAGVMSQKMSNDEGALSVLELAGAAAISPQGQPEPAHGIQPGGGKFGGGGASGEY